MYLEPKKTIQADLENKKGLIFSISLFITMSIVVLAFEWRQYDSVEINLTEVKSSSFEEILDIPSTEIPPPPPPVVQNPKITEVSDQEEVEEIKVKFDIEVTEQTRLEEFVIQEPAKVEIAKEDPDEIFLVVEQSAEPKGGITAFYKYVNENIHYPAQARRTGTEGRVFIEFVVEKDGTLSDIKVVKGIGAGCDEEATRIIQNSPPWNPGKQRGRPVKQRLVLPIIFKLAT